MRIEIDWDLCVGSGLCAAAAEGAFTLVPAAEGPRIVLTDATVDDAALIAAARACPTLAIRLSDAGHRIYPPEANPPPAWHTPGS